jgi:tetratricopeptide (TPR) repeat protein
MKINARTMLAVLAAAVFVAAAVLGSKHWAARNRAAENERRAAEMQQYLDAARQAERVSDWAAARSAAERAAELAQGTEVDETFRQPVEQLLADVALVERLEQIRREQFQHVKEGAFDHAATDRAFAAVFRQHGFDLDAQTGEQTAERIRARPELVAALASALDDWALCRLRGRDKDGAAALIAIARDSDLELQRRQVRAALAGNDQWKLDELAASEVVRKMPPGMLTLLAMNLPSGPASEQAVELLKLSQQQRSDDFWVGLMLADALGSGDPPQREESIALYRRAIELQPKFAGAHENLGAALAATGELDEAITSFRRAIELRPEVAAVHHRLGAALRSADRREEAIASFRRAIELDSKFALAHRDLGIALSEQGEGNEAIASLRQALELSPQQPEALLHLGINLQKRGLAMEAAEILRQVIQLQPESALAHFYLGMALESMTPIEYFGLPPGVVRARVVVAGGRPVAQPAPAMQNIEEAIAFYRQAIELDPQMAQAHHQLGMLLEKAGRPDEAIVPYRRVVELRPNDADALLRLGDLLAGRDSPDEMLAAYSKVADLKPGNVAVRIKQAKALALARKFVEAEKALDKLKPADLQQNSADAREALDLLVNWSGGEHRWKDTDRYLNTLVYGSASGGYLDEGFLHNTMFELMYAPLLLETGDMARYEALRDSALARHGSTRNTMFAERMIMVSLLKPADELQMSVISSLADVTAKINPRTIVHMLRWAYIVQALFEYRSGRYEQALEWGQKCLDLGPHPAVTERARVVMAMSYAKLNQREKAQAELAQCRAHIEEMRQGILDATVYEEGGFWHATNASDKIYNEKGFWHDWLINHILLREALAVLEKGPEVGAEQAADAGK